MSRRSASSRGARQGSGQAFVHASQSARGSTATGLSLQLWSCHSVPWLTCLQVWQQSMSAAPHMTRVVWSARHACINDYSQILWAALHAEKQGVICHHMPRPRRGTQGRTLFAATEAPVRPTAPSGQHPSQPECTTKQTVSFHHINNTLYFHMAQPMALCMRQAQAHGKVTSRMPVLGEEALHDVQNPAMQTATQQHTVPDWDSSQPVAWIGRWWSGTLGRSPAS